MLRSAKRIFVVFIFFIIPILLFTSNAPILQRLIPNNDEFSLPINNGWIYRWEDSEDRGTLTLPFEVKGGSSNRILWISNILPAQKFDYPILFIRTSQQYLKVYIDGQLIYNYGTDADNGYLLPGSSWHLVRLPQSYAGKKVEISLSSPYKQYSGHINSIYIGSESHIVLHVLFHYGSTLVISFIILLFGIILILLHSVIKSDKGRFNSLLHLGTFSILSGTWIVAESKIIQFLINSPVLIFYLACISLFLLPIPLLLFILSVYKIKKGNLLIGLIWFFCTFFIVVSVLQIFNNVTFMNSILFFHIMLLVCIITVIFVSISEIRGGNKGIRIFFLGCIILCAFSIKDMYSFYFSNIPGLNAQGYLQYAILIFIILLCISLGHYILEIFNDQVRNRVYKELAYIDILTGLKNRRSFEEKISNVNQNLGINSNISIIILDLNNLKQTNDLIGHHEGDNLIFKASKLIEECFNNIGEVYRIGGDEFAVVVTGYIESIVTKQLFKFDKKINEYNSQEGHVEISIAYGMASFKKSEDEDLRHVLVRADKAMYKCKKLQKQD